MITWQPRLVLFQLVHSITPDPTLVDQINYADGEEKAGLGGPRFVFAKVSVGGYSRGREGLCGCSCS
jgi:hypothetical protein